MSLVRFMVLASGSQGNCAYLATPHARVLIDCGIGPRTLKRLLGAAGEDAQQLDAVFITHTHSDHVSGLATVLKYFPLRIYAPAQHLPALRELLRGSTASTEIVPVEPLLGFYHRDLDILPVPVSHDCTPTVMYKLHCGDTTVGVLTDLGRTETQHTQLFGDCNLLLLEANHCEIMLACGSYPEVLKRRIRSDSGHLSNRQSAQFATGLPSLPRHLILGHLSDENNRPEVASSAFVDLFAGSIPHTVLPQRTCGPLIEL